ncbi:MAG: efflux RND transporter periplasmic adaptor subunit [Spirochaetales bacterium]|nr:efflux RND transporter periplasmic adaptor subunit [Spirochaetales bacterium]
MKKGIKITLIVSAILLFFVIVLVILGGIRKNIENAEKAEGAATEQGETPKRQKGKGRPEDLSEQERSFPVIVQKLEGSEIVDYLKLNGDITTEVDVDIYPDVAGKVIEIYKEIGDTVRKGDILMKIDPSVPGMKYQPNPVRSTISGTVTARYVQLGATVAPQQPVFKVGIIDQLRIIAYIPERFIARVRPNLVTNVFVDAYPDTVFKAKIVDMSPVVDPMSRTMKVKLEFVGNVRGLRPGMFASIQIIDKVKKNVVVVPTESIVRRYDKEYVFVLGDDGKAVSREVEVGIQKDGRSEIVSGLNSGEFLIVSGQSLLDDGILLNIVNAKDYDELQIYVKAEEAEKTADADADADAEVVPEDTGAEN